MIADVATFPPGDIQYPSQILHAGVGRVNALVVLHPRLNGTLVAAVEPVFSYCEFNLVGTKRLNDDEWKNMLDCGNHTEYLPAWLKDIYGMTDPFPTPEFPHITTVSIATMIITLATIVSRRIFRAKKTAAHV